MSHCKNLRSVSLVLFVLLFGLLPSTALAADPTLILANGRVVAGDGTVMERASVVIAGDRIVAVTEAPVDAEGVRRIDVAGKTVLPGLVDTHVHLLLESMESMPEGDADLEAFLEDGLPQRLRRILAAGITTVASAGDFWPAARRVRERIESGELVGPRLFTAGPVFTAVGGHPAWGPVCGPAGSRKANLWCREHLTVELAGPHDARRAVERLAREGVDFVKMVYDATAPPVGEPLEPAIVEEIIRAAHAHDLRAYAHILESDKAIHAIEAGIDGLVHIPGFAATPEELRQAVERMDREGVTASTTQVAVEMILRSMPPGSEEMAEILEREQAAGRAALELVAREAPHLLVLGTDAPGMDLVESFRRELEILAESGLEPHQVIRAATANAAVHLGRDDDLGTIAPGKLADLIVVDGNPLEDLSALRDVYAVVKGGALLE